MPDYVADIVGVIGTTTGHGGTGHVVARDRVLTARHTLAPRNPNGPAREPGAAKVYPFLPGTPAHLRGIPATPLWWEPTDLPDAVVLQLHPDAGNDTHLLPPNPIEIGMLPADAWVVSGTRGFPKLGSDQVSFTDVLHALPGEAWTSTQDARSGRAIAVTFVSKARMDGDPGGWKGLSGAALLADGVLVGVMREFPREWDASQTLTAEPLAPLLVHDAFCDALGLPRGTRPRAIGPAIAPTKDLAKRDDIAALSAYLFTLDRGDEVRNVGFELQDAAGAPLELLVCGHPDDLCHEFWKAVWRRCLHRRGKAPTAIAWPGAGLPLKRWPRVLASETAARLFGTQAPPADLEALPALLGAVVDAPWVCLALPPTLGEHDLALLVAWRAAWAAHRRADGRAFGYALLHTALAPPSAGLLLPEGAPGAPRQAYIQLRPITLEELAAWDQHLEDLGEPPQAAPLPPLARRFRDQLPRDIAHFRLGDVQRLLDGRALRPADLATSPDWAT